MDNLKEMINKKTGEINDNAETKEIPLVERWANDEHPVTLHPTQPGSD